MNDNHIPANQVQNPFGSSEIAMRQSEGIVQVEAQRGAAR